MLCITFEQIIGFHEPHLKKLVQVGDSYPNADVPEACQHFTQQVRLVEEAVVGLYTTALGISRESPDLRDVANIWRLARLFCDKALRAIDRLRKKCPYCGTSDLYDLALDYKLACD